jgi:anti-sigma factor RsiW
LTAKALFAPSRMVAATLAPAECARQSQPHARKPELTAFLPALFAAVAPPGSANVPVTVGALAFGVTVVSAVAAWSARETYRVHLNDLGDPAAQAVDKAEYDRLRQQSVAAAT